jgi:hypothetical protein
MKWTKLSVATTLAAALIAAPATAYADTVPTTDEVVAVMAKLTDPGIPAMNKGDIVTPGFAPDDAGTIDDHLNSLNGRGYIPFNFVVTDIQPAPGNFAGATVAAPRDYPYYSIRPVPIVLVNQSRHWLVTTDAAMAFLNQMWSSTRHRAGFTAFRFLTANNAKFRA